MKATTRSDAQHHTEKQPAVPNTTTPRSDNDQRGSILEGPQHSRATEVLTMSRQQQSVVIGLLTGHLAYMAIYIKLGRI